MKRRFAFMAIALCMLLSSCIIHHSYRCSLEEVPAWLIGRWEAVNDDLCRLDISSSDIYGDIGKPGAVAEHITIGSDLRANGYVMDERSYMDEYRLRVGYSMGGERRFIFILNDDGTMSLRYTKVYYNNRSTTIDQTFSRLGL